MQRDNPSDRPVFQAQHLWQQTAQITALDDSGPLNDSLQTDVVIVGAGFTGLSTALHLAQSGTRCIVLEAETIGHGGSGRNVGLVNAGLWLPPEQVTGALGEVVGGNLNRALAEGPSLVFSLIEQHAIDCDPLRNGTLHLAHSIRGLDDLESRRRQHSALSAPVKLLDQHATEQITGSSRYLGALQDMRAGTVQPLAYARGLADAAVRAGAQLFCRSPVLALEQNGTTWRIKTVRGQVVAPQVVVATNGYTRSLWPGLDRAIIPVHYFQCASEPLTDKQSARALPQRNGCWDTRRVMMSMRKDRDERLVFGSIGAVNGHNDRQMLEWAARMCSHIFPAIGSLHWSHCWHGRIAFTPDHIPRMYQLAPGVMTCIGYNGRGIAPGTVCGKAMAGLINGAPINEFPLPVEPLQPVALNRFLAVMIDAGTRVLHRLQGRFS